MQKPRLSLHSVLEALDLDSACIPLLEKTEVYTQVIQSKTPEEVYAAIRIIGQALDVRERADQLAEHLEERINIIVHKLKFIPKEQRPSVLCLRELSPAIRADREYLDRLVDLAGGISYADRDPESVNPDILILINDRPVSQLLSELPHTLTTGHWADTPAVKNGNIYLVYDGRYLRQPGARTADDMEILAEIINPKYFIFGRDADAWMPFSL